MKDKKICFAASSGGHYEQLMMLKPLMEKYDSFVITEKTGQSAKAKGEKTYYMNQVNRREKDFVWQMIVNTWKSIGICGYLYGRSGDDSNLPYCKTYGEKAYLYRIICKGDFAH